jgi:hypothetical protein
MDDLNLRDVEPDKDIDKMWENKYPQTKILLKFFEAQSYIRSFIAADLCSDQLHLIEIIYQACGNSTAGKPLLKSGSEATKTYLKYNDEALDLIKKLTEFKTHLDDDDFMKIILDALVDLRQMIDEKQSKHKDPSGGPAGGQQRPDGGQQRPDGGQEGDQQHVDTDDEEEHEDGMGDHSIRTPSSSPASPPPPHVYGRRVNPEHNGVLTYYVLYLDEKMEATASWLLTESQKGLCELFDVPSDSIDIKVRVKEQNLAKYEIVPITLDAELTFTIWEIDADHIAVYYCGMYEPGQNADPDIKTLKSPPELPDV